MYSRFSTLSSDMSSYSMYLASLKQHSQLLKTLLQNYDSCLEVSVQQKLVTVRHIMEDNTLPLGSKWVSEYNQCVLVEPIINPCNLQQQLSCSKPAFCVCKPRNVSYFIIPSKPKTYYIIQTFSFSRIKNTLYTHTHAHMNTCILSCTYIFTKDIYISTFLI